MKKGIIFIAVIFIVSVPIVCPSSSVKRLLENDASYVESRLHQMDLKIQQLTSQLATKGQEIARLNQKIKNNTDDLIMLRSGQMHSDVAFTAILDHDETLGAHQILRYSYILTNDGNAYDFASGIFEAPVAGLYSLSASMMGNPSNSIHLQLVRNGKELARLWTGGAGSAELASHTLNVHLSRNDKIWVQNADSANRRVYGAEKFNIFSGALLHAV